MGYKNSIRQPRRSGRWLSIARHDSIAAMLASLLYLVLRRLLTLVAPNRRSGHVAQIEILVLRHQLEVLRTRWGYMRIKGELGKLGIRASATSIAMLLRRS